MTESAIEKKALQHDKDGEENHNLMSAFLKSLRGDDLAAALYWLGRTLTAGEDPLYVARRMFRFGSEDVGNAHPRALSIPVSFQFMELWERESEAGPSRCLFSHSSQE